LTPVIYTLSLHDALPILLQAGDVFRRSPSMGRKLYVGNLSYGTTDSDLQRLFEAHGTVQSAQVVMDRDTGRSRGFGFVEMGSDRSEEHTSELQSPYDLVC